MVASTTTLYDEQIITRQQQPQALEQLYQQAKQYRDTLAFQAAVQRIYLAHPDDQLLAAWYYRLQAEIVTPSTIQWRIVTIISVVLAGLLWVVSLPAFTLGVIPLLVILWPPLIASAVMTLLAMTGQGNWRWFATALSVLAVATGYTTAMIATQTSPSLRDPRTIVLLLHLPLIAVGAIALFVVGPTRRSSDVHGFIWKSIETIGIAGVFAIVGAMFTGLIFALFLAINLTPDTAILRLLVASGASIIAMVAIMVSYQPSIAPGEQDTERGFARLIGIATQLLVPLSLSALILYLVVLPTNFLLVFSNRDSLIIYNILLFGAVALIVAATPLSIDAARGERQVWLRRGIIILASIVTIISLHALAAIVYRTTQYGVSINRAVIIGWNGINIALLIAFLVNQVRAGGRSWVARAQSVFAIGGIAYLVWAGIILASVPWLLLA